MASPDRLARRLGTRDAVVLGLGAMIGAGVFAAFGPAAAAAGGGLLVALGIAAVVAFCNATSSARLAARHPESGGTYVYGRERLGPFWGYLAGWAFVLGKTASCAAMALTVASYVWPGQARWVALTAVVLVTAVDARGVQKSVLVTRIVLGGVLAVLAVVAVVGFTAGSAAPQPVLDLAGVGPWELLQGAGILFFAFAGYARVATLGEEVREPARSIPRAIGISLAVAVGVYAVVALAALLAVGPAGLAATTAPLRAVVDAGPGGLGWLVGAGGALAALGALLSLLLGVSRTVLAMSRDGYLPRPLAVVHPAYGVPHRATLAVGAVVAVLVVSVDLRGVIGFSSFGVLAYYAIANVAAATLGADERRPPRWLPPLGVLGCLALALAMPVGAVVTGAALLLAVTLLWLLAFRSSARSRHPGGGAGTTPG